MHMGVYEQKSKDGIKRWYVKANYWDPNTGRKAQHCKRGFTNPKDAKAYETAFLLKHPQKGSTSLSELLQGILGTATPKPMPEPEKPKMTFLDVFNEYWKTKAIDLRDSTKETKSNMLQKHILDYFQAYAIEDITSVIVKQWQTEMKQKTRRGKPFSETYLHSIQSQLNAILNFAVRKKYIPFSPMADLKNMGQKDAPPREIWTIDEYKRFAEYAQQRPDTYMLFELYFWLGLRRGEGLGIRCMDIFYDKRTESTMLQIATSVDAKHRVGMTKNTSSYRTLALPEIIETELREYMSKKYDLQPEDRIFEHVSVSQLQRDITWAIQQAGVPKICIHGMRHSAASLMIANSDMTYTDVADTLGHKSAKTTATTYAHILPTTKTKFAQYVDALHQDK